MSIIVKKWKLATQAVANEFAAKYFPQEREQDTFWAGNEIGDVFCISDMFFDVDRMIAALELNATIEQICEYYYDEIEYCSNNPSKPMFINFKNFIKYGWDLAKPKGNE